MLHFTHYVGVAPGTTTFRRSREIKNGRLAGGFGQPTPGAIYPTQSVVHPNPNIDNIQIDVPPNQWVTGPSTMTISVPKDQNVFGPVPNDGGMAPMRPYQPLLKSWIATQDGPIFHLQGAGLGQGMSTSEKFAIAASLISAVALATTTYIAVARYKKGR